MIYVRGHSNILLRHLEKGRVEGMCKTFKKPQYKNYQNNSKTGGGSETDKRCVIIHLNGPLDKKHTVVYTTTQQQYTPTLNPG